MGRVCEICQTKYLPHPTTGKYPRFLEHHLAWTPSEIKAVVCLACSNWLHGNGRVYSHPLKPPNMTKDEQALGPFFFAAAVVQLYDEKVILPAVLDAAKRQRAAIINGPAEGKYAKDTAH